MPGRPVLDAGASWLRGAWTVSVGVQNLLDQRNFLLDQRNFLYGDGAGVSWLRGAWTVSVGVQNLLDQRNFLYGDGTGGGALPGAGRTAWARLAAHL